MSEHPESIALRHDVYPTPRRCPGGCGSALVFEVAVRSGRRYRYARCRPCGWTTRPPEPGGTARGLLT